MDVAIELGEIKSAEKTLVNILRDYTRAIVNGDRKLEREANQKLKRYLALIDDRALDLNKLVEGKPVFHHVVASGYVSLAQQFLADEEKKYKIEFEKLSDCEETVLHALAHGEVVALSYLEQHQVAQDCVALNMFTEMAELILDYVEQNIDEPDDEDEALFINRRDVNNANGSAINVAAAGGAPRVLAELLKYDVYINQCVVDLSHDTSLRLVVGAINATDNEQQREALRDCLYLLCAHGAAIGVHLPREFFQCGVQFDYCPMFFARTSNGQLITHASPGLNKAILNLPDWIRYYKQLAATVDPGTTIEMNFMVLRCMYEAEDLYEFDAVQLQQLKTLQVLFTFFNDPRFARSVQQLTAVINNPKLLQTMLHGLQQMANVDQDLLDALNHMAQELLPQQAVGYQQGAVAPRLTQRQQNHLRMQFVDDYERLEGRLRRRSTGYRVGAWATGVAAVMSGFCSFLFGVITAGLDVQINYWEEEPCFSWFFRQLFYGESRLVDSRVAALCVTSGKGFSISTLIFVVMLIMSLFCCLRGVRFSGRERRRIANTLAPSAQLDANGNADDIGNVPRFAPGNLSALITQHRAGVAGFAHLDPLRGRDDMVQLQDMADLPAGEHESEEEEEGEEVNELSGLLLGSPQSREYE